MARSLSEALFGGEHRPPPQSPGFFAWWGSELAALWPTRRGRLPRRRRPRRIASGKIANREAIIYPVAAPVKNHPHCDPSRKTAPKGRSLTITFAGSAPAG